MENDLSTLSLDDFARALGGTTGQVKALMRQNAADLEVMANKAQARGKRINGYTEDQLRESAARLRARAEGRA